MRNVENIEVAWVLAEIADLLEVKGEDVFKIRAYRRASRAVKNLTIEITELAEKNQLDKISGVGKNIATKLKELISEGKMEYLERLKKEVPDGITEIMAIPGVGPKMAQTLTKKLGIKNIEDLEEALRKRKVRELPGMGSKTEMNLVRGIEMLRTGASRVTLGIAWAVADGFKGFLTDLSYVNDVAVAGSARRMKESVGDIDLVVSTDEPERVGETFIKHPQVKDVLAKGKTKVSVVLKIGLQVDLRLVTSDEFWPTIHHFTGSKEHNVRLRERSHKYGIKINEYGLFKAETEEKITVSSEEEIYSYLDLAYIPPELREDRGEVSAAEKGTLPELLTEKDIKGDLHLHSSWSDGVNSIEEIVQHAEKLGYEYIAVTDHSKSLGIARGLSEERLARQAEDINKINEKGGSVKVLRGIEADILSNGDMDYPDDILAEKDIVIGSIHSGFRQSKEQITDRIISAIKNEHVDIIAHPTGRLVGRREPYAVDIEKVMDMAAKYDTVLEINSSPDRLDLNDVHVRQAKEKGIKIAINTDAHEIQRMNELRFGVGTARRGWLETEDVINTWNYEKLTKYLKSKDGKNNK